MQKKDYILSLVSGLLIAILSLLVLKFNFSVSSFWILWLITIPFLCFTGIFISSILKDKIPVVWQFAKFIVVGSLSALIDLGVLNILMFLTKVSDGFFFVFIKAFSFLMALINSYFWNKVWTFEKKGKNIKEGFRFFIISVIGFIINISIAFIVVNIISPKFGVNSIQWANIAGITAILVAMFWNFIGFKFLVFKK